MKRYYLIVFAFMMHGVMQRNKKMRGGSLGDTLTRDWFKHTNLTDFQLDQLFDAVSFKLTKLPDTKQPLGFADFGDRSHPSMADLLRQRTRGW